MDRHRNFKRKMGKERKSEKFPPRKKGLKNLIKEDAGAALKGWALKQIDEGEI